MLNSFFNYIVQNKNLLMLFSVSIYILALVATLTENLLFFAIILFIFSLFLLIKNYISIKYIIIWNLLFYIGVANLSCRLKNVDELLNLAPVNSEITGTIVSIPQGLKEGKIKFFFEVDNIKFETFSKDLKDEKLLVTINDCISAENLKIYNSLKLTGRLATPFKAGNPSQFDYGIYLRNHGTYAVFYAQTYELIDGKRSVKSNILQKISDYRENVIEIHSKYIKSPYLEILGGIVFGDDAISPSKEIKQSFVNSGLLHILAASGMNVAFIYTFFFFILSRLKVKFRLSVILGMIMVIVYTFMTGLGASIIRAACMLLFVLVGKLIDRDAHSVSLLFFVGLLMLLYNPLFINDVGFQLSFIVTFGILLMAPTVIMLKNKLLHSILGVISIPVIAQLWVIPVQIFYFNNISVYSIFANIMSVPIIMILSFGGFVSSLLAGIPVIAEPICRLFDFILNPLLKILVSISDFWGNLPYSTIQTSHPTILQILLYYLMLLVLTGILYKDLREKYLKKLVSLLVVLSMVWIVLLIPIKNSNLEVTAFDVANADCFMIKTPENKYIVIDTGKPGYKGGKSQAEIILLKYLKDRGIKSLDTLIITHFDNDHCGGAVDLINQIKVETVFVNDLMHNSVSAKSIYKAIEDNNVKLIKAENNQMVYNKNGLKLVNLLGVNTDNDNENSIMTLLNYNNFKMLFTGDVSSKGLKNVLNNLPENITVLKVPHHGASGCLNKEILAKLKPEYSIISTGENKFGHPSFYILEILKDSKILRTDIDNSILLKVNKNKLKVLTYDIKKRKYLEFK